MKLVFKVLAGLIVIWIIAMALAPLFVMDMLYWRSVITDNYTAWNNFYHVVKP